MNLKIYRWEASVMWHVVLFWIQQSDAPWRRPCAHLGEDAFVKSCHRGPSAGGVRGRGSELRGRKPSCMCVWSAQFFIPVLSPEVSYILSLSLFQAPSLPWFFSGPQVPNSFPSYPPLKSVSNPRPSFMPVLVVFCTSWEREKCGGHCAFLKLYSEPSSLSVT